MDSIYQGRTFEWDRPGRGLYDDGSIRIITRRDPDGGFACHKASDEEVKLIMLLEKLETMSNTDAKEILKDILNSELRSVLKL